jgi:hypothetical protein
MLRSVFLQVPTIPDPVKTSFVSIYEGSSNRFRQVRKA